MKHGEIWGKKAPRRSPRGLEGVSSCRLWFGGDSMSSPRLPPAPVLTQVVLSVSRCPVLVRAEQGTGLPRPSAGTRDRHFRSSRPVLLAPRSGLRALPLQSRGLQGLELTSLPAFTLAEGQRGCPPWSRRLCFTPKGSAAIRPRGPRLPASPPHRENPKVGGGGCWEQPADACHSRESSLEVTRIQRNKRTILTAAAGQGGDAQWRAQETAWA